MPSALSLRFYDDAQLTQELSALSVSGQEGRFADSHRVIYLGSPDPDKKWINAANNGEIWIWSGFDQERWFADTGNWSTPAIASASILLCDAANYVPNDENCFSNSLRIDGDILGGVANAVPIHLALYSYEAGDIDYFRLYTDLLEEIDLVTP